jgi:hypothetical protein
MQLYFTNEPLISDVSDSGAEFCAPTTTEAECQKPRLLVEDCNPDCTLAALRNILAAAGELYDRGVPVRPAFDQLARYDCAGGDPRWARISDTCRVPPLCRKNE